MSPRGPGLAILLCLTGCFLLIGSREPPWGDARIMYEVAENLALRQQVAVKSEWPPMSHKGKDGKVYSQYALGPSLVSVPGVWLRDRLAPRTSPSAPLARVVTSHLAQAVMGALTCMLFFGLCRRLGASARAASAGTLTLAFATMVLVYARSPFSEITQAACLLGFVTALIAVVDEPTRRRALYAGAWGAAVLNAKAVLALSLVGGAVYLVVVLRRDRAALGRVLGWAAVAGAPGVAVFLLYNQARWGSPFDTGYGDTLGLMRESPIAGLWGLLLSPGKSLFLYSPPLLLGLLAVVRFARAHRRAALALALVGLPPVAFYASFLSWSGDYCWGPRYLTYLVPLLLVPAVVSAWPTLVRSRAAASAAAVLVVLGLGVQVLGAAFYWDHWIRIAMHARFGWLGNPDRSGASPPRNQLGLCDACFEDMHGHQWLPPLSPVAGHAWLLAHRGEPWATAQRAAPWRRYTRVDLPGVETYYKAVRLDWWGFIWLDDQPKSRGLGVGLLLAFAALATGGGVWWWRRVRAAAGDADEPAAPAGI